MEVRSFLLMLVVFVPLLQRLNRSYQKGLALAVALLVALPDSLRISIGGGIPELTIQRLILGGMVFCRLSAPMMSRPRLRTPFLNGVLLLGAAQFVSLVLSVDHVGSLKSFFAFAVEIVAYYVILSADLPERDRIPEFLKVLVTGVGVVAFIAAIERRWEFNLSRFIILGDGASGLDIVSTYPHRIILGYAMAMTIPVILALIEREKHRIVRRNLWGVLLLTVAACYFSNSRGPWSGLIVATIPMLLVGSRATRRGVAAVAILALVVLIARPGVRQTLVSAFESTFQSDSLKGKSYEYRWVLWHVAFAEITKSPERALFGYGGLSTETMDLGHYFEKESGGSAQILGYTSWDNQLACDLIEFGFVGFFIELTVLIGVLFKLLSNWRKCRGPDRGLLLAFASSCVIYVYALTNVYIFSPQLKCLFWALVACGLRFGAGAMPRKDDSKGSALGSVSNWSAVRSASMNETGTFA